MLQQKLNDENYCTEVPEKLSDNTLVKKDTHKKIINFSLLSKNYQDNLKKLENKSIIPSETQCISEANFAQGSVVQNYCIATTTQSLIIPPDEEFKDVPKIQQNAQEHANFWLSGLNNKVVGINSGLKQYCNLIMTYENDMDNLVDEVVNDVSGAKDNFLNQIGLLRDQANTREQKIIVITNELGSFRKYIGQDGSNFKSIQSKADIKYNANTGEMKKLKDTIDALNASIQAANAMIAGGAVLAALGSLVIVVGVLAGLTSGGATAAVVGAGVTMIGSGGGLIGVAIDNRNKASAELSKAYVRYNTLQQTCSLLKAINEQLTSLITGNEQSVRAVQAISLALSVIAENLTGIIDNIDLIVDNVEGGAVLKRLLNLFVANAKSLKELYAKYESTGILPVQPDEQVWNSLFPYRAKPIAFSNKPIAMEEYAFLIDKKLAWQRRYTGVYIPQTA
ncbi:hypothetical protein BEV13_04725 [Rickettsiella grylli]|uniref:HBL/NHE enterotoxin family protein n=1 Tax=Rickettsiella grylli TaxID=59196 RepID=UPI0008FD0F7C|nr:HBL/NHE enterotoxin family protein [Rickettsiella grylli]OIZ99934.1 hypothetical protein BEV13_04725 [Rickettsiella grylli]